MKRRLLNLLTALSLLLCVVVVALWVRSYLVNDWLGHRRLGVRGDEVRISEWKAWTGNGNVLLSREAATTWADQIARRSDADLSLDPPLPRGWFWDVSEPQGGSIFVRPPPTYWEERGFVFRKDGSDPANWDLSYSRHLGFPLWLPAILLAGMPAFALRCGLAAASRRASGLCPSCGYDLRATPGRCPECGSSAPTVSGSAEA